MGAQDSTTFIPQCFEEILCEIALGAGRPVVRVDEHVVSNAFTIIHFLAAERAFPTHVVPCLKRANARRLAAE